MIFTDIRPETAEERLAKWKAKTGNLVYLDHHRPKWHHYCKVIGQVVSTRAIQCDWCDERRP